MFKFCKDVDIESLSTKQQALLVVEGIVLLLTPFVFAYLGLAVWVVVR